MPEYRRSFLPGETFFFTVVTHDRAPILCSELARPILRAAIERVQRDRPFDLQAIVLLPDHLHAIWTLPPDDADFSTRWAAIKGIFTRAFLAAGGEERTVPEHRAASGERAVWQARFFDHAIRDDDDFARHLDYLHFNPVKHAYATCPHAYSHSTFKKWVTRQVYEREWCCTCRKRIAQVPGFEWVGVDME